MTAISTRAPQRRCWPWMALVLALMGLAGCLEARSYPEEDPGSSSPGPLPEEGPLGPPPQEEPAPGTVRIAAFNVHRFFDTVCESGTCGGSAYEELPTPEVFTSRAVRLAQALASLKAGVVL